MSAIAVLLITFASFALEYNEATLVFKDQCLKWHNEYRLKHQVNPVTWNDTLAKGAEDWATYLADNNLFKHATNIVPGENLYRSGTPLPDEPCTEASQLFYGEVKYYDYNKPGFAMNTGHFTQLVWKNTKEIGASVKTRKDGLLVVVIRYFPAGNYNGEGPFRANVLPPKDWQVPTEAGAAQTHSSFAFTVFSLAAGSAFKYCF